MKKIIIFALSILMLNACSKTNEVTPDVKIENQKNVILSKNVNLTNLSTLLAQDADFNSFVSITNAQKNHVLTFVSALNKEQLTNLKNDLDNAIKNNTTSSYPQLLGFDPAQYSEDFKTMTLNISNVHTKFSDLKGLSENDFIKVIDDAIKIIEPVQSTEEGKCQTAFDSCDNSNKEAFARGLLDEQGANEAKVRCAFAFIGCHMSFQD